MSALMQLSVFAENRPGKIEKITRVLAEEGINILAISISSSGDFGVIKFILDKCEAGVSSLRSKGFTVSLNEVLGIELHDKPGSLHDVVLTLMKHNINVENAHVFVAGSRDRAYLIVEVEDVPTTKELLKNEKIGFYQSSNCEGEKA